MASELNKASTKKPLRFGVMVNGTHVSKWEQLCLEKILSLPNAPKLVLFIVDASKDESPDYSKLSFLKKVKSVGFRNIAYYLFNKYRSTPKSTELTSIEHLQKGVEIVYLKTEKRDKYSEYFGEKDIEEIKSHDLDFILRFGFGIIRGNILNVPRYGVWSYHHDDEMKYRGGPSCFWEIYKKDPVTGSVLQKITERLDGGIILKKGYFHTVSNSYEKNIDQAYFESAIWASQLCIEIQNDCTRAFDAAPTHSTAKVLRTPNNLEMGLFLWRLYTNKFRAAVLRSAPELAAYPIKSHFVADSLGAEYESRLKADKQNKAA